jgi:hypothetical protein
LPLQSRWRNLLFLTIAAILTVTGCTSGGEKPLEVWSNTTDAAYFVERYNLESDTPVYFRYVPNLTETLTQERVEADVVIGRWVHTPDVDEMVVPTPVPGDAFAPPFKDVSGPWLPLSYTLPTIVFDRTRSIAGDTFTVTLETLAEVISPGPDGDEETPVFAPRSTPESVYAVYRSLGFTTSIAPDGTPDIQERELQSAIERVTRWTQEFYGSLHDESTFIRDVLYDPPIRQIETGRVATVYQGSNDLFRWSFFEDQRLQFRWLGLNDGTIAANEDIVYAGVLGSSTRKEKAHAFLRWLTDSDVQTELIEGKIHAGIDTFGFFGGFSTVSSVNDVLAHHIYPTLTGRIPHPSVIRLPSAHPRYWEEAVDAVVHPFLMRPTDAADLQRSLNRWYLQRGD